MNSLKIKGNLNEVAGKFEQKYADLTDNEWLFKKGQEKELLGRHQKKIGKIKDEIRTLLARI